MRHDTCFVPSLGSRDADPHADDLPGPGEATPAMDAEHQLEEIARTVERVRREMDSGGPDTIDEDMRCQPLDWDMAPRIPSCEDWPLAYDPFNEPFVEEEVVIVDRFSLPELPAPTYAAATAASTLWEPEATRASDSPRVGTAADVVHDDRSPTDIPEQMVSSDHDGQKPATDELQVLAAPTSNTPPRTGRQVQFQRLFANMRTPQPTSRPRKT